MAKKLISITSFKAGLDARRDELSSTPGTLKIAQDGFLTSGGDFEKRKSFMEFASLSILDSLADQGTFGIQDTINGLYTFGSALSNGSAVTQSQPTLASAMPTGVTYQQLKHPAIYDGETYDRTKHRMTSALISEVFNGLPQVVATFADGYKYMYYDGDLVGDVVDGLRMVHLSTNILLAKNLARVVTARGNQLTAAYVDGNTYVDISGPSSLDFSSLVDTILTTGSTGALGQATTVVATDRVPGATAKGKFRIIAGEESPSASSTLTNDGTAPNNNSTVVINGVTYTWKTVIASNNDVLIGVSNDTAMQNLIYAINYTGTPGVNYIATGPHATVKVTSAYNTGANTFVVTARTPGTGGNAITTTQAGTSHCTWTGATLSGGADTNAITSVKVGTFDIINVASPIIFIESAIATAKRVAAAINTYATDYTAESEGDAVYITAASEGASQNGTSVSVTTQGQLCIGSLSAAFVLGGTGFTFNVFNVNGVDISGTMTGATVGAAKTYTTLDSFCQALADAILVVGTYTAVAQGNIVYVSKITTTSEDAPLNAFVSITPDATTGVGSGVTVNNVNQTGAFLVDIIPSLNVTKSGTPVSGTGGWVISTDWVAANPYFGAAPYGFSWEKIDGSDFINAWFQGLSYTFFYLNAGLIFIKGVYTARFKCVVTDALGRTSESGIIIVTINYL